MLATGRLTVSDPADIVRPFQGIRAVCSYGMPTAVLRHNR